MYTATIYGLVNPVDDKIFYVGRTENPIEIRLYNHLKKSDLKIGVCNKNKIDIINTILGLGMQPQIISLEKIIDLTKLGVIEKSKIKEKDWIASISLSGIELTNVVHNPIKNIFHKPKTYKMKVICLQCNKEFDAQRNTAKFCSPNCRVKFNNKEEVIVPEIPVITPKTKMVVTKSGSLELKPSDEKIKEMKLTMDKINKDYGSGSVMMLGDKPSQSVSAISTGSIKLDKALGIGGLPTGRMVEIYGPESSGKTTLAIHVIAEAQRIGGKCAFIDAEHAFDSDYASNLGVNIDDLLISQPDYGEQALEIADRLIAGGGYSVVVVDSVAALVPKSELEGEMGDSKMMLQARLMSQACRKLTGSVSKTNTLLIFINQLRMKLVTMPFQNPEVVPGGNALKFYASVRLDIRRLAQLKDGEEILGNRTKVKVVKNKVAAPFKVVEFDILYGEGIDHAGEIIDMAVDMEIIQKSGSWYSYDSSKLGQGREAIRQLLEDNLDLLSEIEAKVKNIS